VERARQERISENIRLLYVALTRARQRCYLVWGKVNRMHNAALPWLFYPDFDGSNEYVKDLEYDEIVGPVRDLAIHSSGGITWSNVEQRKKPATVSPRGTASSADLRARSFAGRTPSPGWGIASYTSLTMNWSRSSHDRDSAAEPMTVPQERDHSIFCFPSGARTGIVWHDLFENLDFQTGDAEIDAIAGGIPRKAGAPSEFAPAIGGMIRSALDRPITPDGGRLKDLAQTVRELEFTFTISRFRTDEVRRVLQDPAFGLDPVFREAAVRLAYREVSGFMMGAIDLLFLLNGRYFLADYKSNSLGSRVADYAPERLREVMGREHYYLQYLIYTVAAHRYLSKRVPGYSYDEHFGGVAYLFLRGMTAGQGVFFDRPQRSLIDALEAVLSIGGRP
jgi:exodeoxyribonuclease V beta subunit